MVSREVSQFRKTSEDVNYLNRSKLKTFKYLDEIFEQVRLLFTHGK